jgi:hypothetical protein
MAFVLRYLLFKEHFFKKKLSLVTFDFYFFLISRQVGGSTRELTG